MDIRRMNFRHPQSRKKKNHEQNLKEKQARFISHIMGKQHLKPGNIYGENGCKKT